MFYKKLKQENQTMKASLEQAEVRWKKNETTLAQVREESRQQNESLRKFEVLCVELEAETGKKAKKIEELEKEHERLEKIISLCLDEEYAKKIVQKHVSNIRFNYSNLWEHNFLSGYLPHGDLKIVFNTPMAENAREKFLDEIKKDLDWLRRDTERKGYLTQIINAVISLDDWEQDDIPLKINGKVHFEVLRTVTMMMSHLKDNEALFHVTEDAVKRVLENCSPINEEEMPYPRGHFFTYPGIIQEHSFKSILWDLVEKNHNQKIQSLALKLIIDRCYVEIDYNNDGKHFNITRDYFVPEMIGNDFPNKEELLSMAIARIGQWERYVGRERHTELAALLREYIRLKPGPYNVSKLIKETFENIGRVKPVLTVLEYLSEERIVIDEYGECIREMFVLISLILKKAPSAIARLKGRSMLNFSFADKLTLNRIKIKLGPEFFSNIDMCIEEIRHYWCASAGNGKFFLLYQKIRECEQAENCKNFGDAMDAKEKSDTEYLQNLWQSAYKRADPYGCYELGKSFNEKGDVDKAIEILNVGAENGSCYCMNQLGMTYAHDSRREYNKAFEWYMKAANLGMAEAMFNIGGLYLSGKGVKKDDTLAFEWLEKAVRAEQKFHYNSYLGDMNRKGIGVEEVDLKKAMVCYKQGAKYGDGSCFESIALLYAYGGSEFEKDIRMAVKWFQLGENLGFSYIIPKEVLDEIFDLPDLEELKAAAWSLTPDDY